MATINEMDKMLTVNEVCNLFRIHPNTLRRWAANGTIKAYHITPRGDYRFKQEDLEQFIVKMNTEI
jgi:excisionase family DNA binding protein